LGEKNMKNQKSNGKKKAVVITYNNVNDYPEGKYTGKDWEVTVHSNNNTKTWGRENAPRMLGEILHKLNGEVKADKVYLYAGLYALDGALHAASHLANQNVDLSIVACYCDWERKKSAAKQMGVELIQSECGGRRTLSEIVNQYVK
jgi:hypothetical protein